MLIQLTAVQVKPLRLTFAQMCIWCGERWCESAACVAKHDLSTWGVCDRCDGTLDGPRDGDACGWCCYGVVEVAHPGDPIGVELACVAQ